MRYRFWVLLLSVLSAALVTDRLFAQSTDTNAVARLSFVQGQVSLSQGETRFDQSQANMPLFDGYTLQTGQDGQAEVEFPDGSVARLTPNSQLRLDHLPPAGSNDEVTSIEMLAGLGYFELNTGNGQRFEVHFGPAVAAPAENAIFRINLDDAPELAVFAGSVHASADGGFDRTVEQGSSVRIPQDNPENATVSASITNDSWDRWNQDRDTQIAQEAQQQTSARDQSGAASQPGWDDLDYYGDWYPMEGYGDVWVPGDVPAGWDPYGNGYWANYPTFGYTWISAYPWGWLPYHCGAWNYWNSFGWGWVPGQCGLGWQTGITIWNAPRGWAPPPRPIPGGHIGEPVRINRLIAVKRGPAYPMRGLGNEHTRPVRVDGQRIDPLPVVPQNPTLGARYSYRGTGAPATGVGFTGNSHVMTPPAQGTRSAPPLGGTTAPRPVFRSAPVEARPAAPAPRVATPPPAPRISAPEPHFSAPPPAASAPHESAPSGRH